MKNSYEENRMRNKVPRRGFLISCLLYFFLFSFLILSGCGRKAPPAVGDKPPKFTLPDLKGGQITAPDDFIGSVVAIRFWVDWCKACAEEMPALDNIYHKYKDRGLVVLAVNVGQTKDVASVFATRLKISYPVLLDASSAVSNRYGVKVVPVTLIIDRKGVIRNRILGETGRDTFEKMVRDLL